MYEIQIFVNGQIRNVNGQTWFNINEVIQFLENYYAVDSLILFLNSLTAEEAMEELNGYKLAIVNKKSGEYDLIELLPELDAMI